MTQSGELAVEVSGLERMTAFGQQLHQCARRLGAVSVQGFKDRRRVIETSEVLKTSEVSKPVNPSNPSLLMPEGFDGVEPGCLASREVPEEDAHRPGEEKGDHHDLRIPDKGNLQNHRPRIGSGQS